MKNNQIDLLVEHLTSEIGTAAALFAMQYFAAKQEGRQLDHGLDSIIRPILHNAIVEFVNGIKS